MFKLLREAYQASVAACAAAKARRRLEEIAYQQLTWPGNRYVDDEGGVVFDPRKLRQRTDLMSAPITLDMLNRARSRARVLARTNPFARNFVTQVVNHVVGRGFAVKFEDEALSDQWKAQAKAIRWKRRRREIVRRIARDGECFIRRFGSHIRFVEPDLVAPLSAYSDMPLGIRTQKDDVETVLAYGINGEEVDAREVFHFVGPDTDINDLRGWPIIYDAEPLFTDYANFIGDRALLNRFRSTVLMFKEYKGLGPAQIRQVRDAVKSGTLTRADGSSAPFITFGNRGRIIEHPDTEKYEFKSPNVGGSDAEVDGRTMRLLLAVFFSFPEYVMTSDASNANFASTAVAESPGVKALEAWQECYADQLSEFIPWVMDEPDAEPEFTFPSLVVRDEAQITQARAVRFNNGVLSSQTWMEMDGLDPRREMQRIANSEEVVVSGG